MQESPTEPDADGSGGRTVPILAGLAAMVGIAAVAIALLMPSGGAAPAPQVPEQRSADGYTRYELQAPSSGAFLIRYDVTATTPGARRYYNTVQTGAEERAHGVVDLHSGEPLGWRVVTGAEAREGEHPTAAGAGRYIEVTLRTPVPEGGGARIRIDKTYTDPDSYYADGGAIVFSRSISVPRNSVVLPPGFELVSVNVPSQVDTEPDGRIRVSFMNPNGQSLRYTVRARALPDALAAERAGVVAPEGTASRGGSAAGAASSAAASASPGSAPAAAATATAYDGSYARTERTFGERAAETRDIVYFLEQPESHAFRLFHDYTESRPGVDRYVNVVRAGSRVLDPQAFMLDTGEELRVETLRGARIADRDVLPAGSIEEGTEVVVIDFPPVARGTSSRLRIHETYVDEARYLRAGDELVWDRRFGRAMNTVVLPQGWYLVASDIPASVSENDDGRTRVTFWNPRPDGIQVFLRARPRDEPVAMSLFGERLYARPHPDPLSLAAVDAALDAAPDDVERMLDAARERRHAFRYDEEIARYSRILERAPDDWRALRFRGHRYLSVRDFARGVADLTRARVLAPYDFDVSYHLGFALYLTGRFDDAANEYLRCIRLAEDPDALGLAGTPDLAGQRTCMTIAERADTRVAVEEWAYRALRRAGRHAEAEAIVDAIPPGLDVTVNDAYYKALLSRKGEWSAAELLLPTPPSGRFETRAYGLAVDELLDGDSDRARFLLRRIAADPHWPGFGRIAAEADLLRLEADL